jgi:hypothetical protein
MRTTLVIEDELLASVKKHAADQGCSVSLVVSEALRHFLGDRENLGSRSKFHMPTFAASGEAVDSLPIELHRIDAEAELTPFQP